MIRPCRRLVIPTRPFLRHSSGTAAEAQEGEQAEDHATVDDEYAWNNVEKKKGKIKPTHTVEEQIAYMKSNGMFWLS